MAYAPREFKVWRYVTDQNENIAYKIDARIVAQTDAAPPNHPKVGGTEADGSEGNPDDGFHPRVALMYNATNKLARRVICFDNTCSLYAVKGGTLNIAAGINGDVLSFTNYGYEGERTQNKRPTV